MRAPGRVARRPVRLFAQKNVRGHLSARPDFLELGGLPLLEFHSYHLPSQRLVRGLSPREQPGRQLHPVVSKSDNHYGCSGATSHRELETFLLLRRVAYATLRRADIRAYSSGRAKTKRPAPCGPPIIPGKKPSTQLPQPIGTATYCFPSML